MNLEKLRTEKKKRLEKRGYRRAARHTAPLGCDSAELDPERPLFSIGTAAAMLEVHPRTLRIYEEEGLIKPFRKSGRRYFSLNDIQWIKCLRHMIHDQGISIAGIKRLLELTPCWQIADCPAMKRNKCSACGWTTVH